MHLVQTGILLFNITVSWATEQDLEMLLIFHVLRGVAHLTQPVLPVSIHPSPCVNMQTWHPHLNLLSDLLFEKHLTEAQP